MQRMSLEEYKKTIKKHSTKHKQYPEYIAQCAVFAWAADNMYRYPKLKWLHSSQNGTYMTKPAAKRAVAAGMKRGVPDIFLPVKNTLYMGLFIEMKSATGSTSKYQKEYIKYLDEEGYIAIVCKSAEDAIENIQYYLNS